MIPEAKFLRADIHIHSFGENGSYDVEDVTMTPNAIVDTAIEKGLSIISITDHNEIQNSNLAIKYSIDKNILVIPGIEVSTTQGHLLVYFDTFNQLRNFYGKLTISEDKKTCQQGIVECLNFAKQFDGIGVLAHIEIDAGFEKTIGRFGPQIEEIFKHTNLYGLEISSKSSIDFYTNSDENPDRKKLLNLRIEHLGFEKDYNLAKLMSSDSHSLERLGTNADGEKKLTRIKLDELNFHSFKIALLSNESRIRVENFIPEKRPVIKSVKIESKLFGNIDVNLSPNLTCIIGGRGAGKSTLLESIRETSGNKTKSSLVDSEVWPQSILLKYEDETGQTIEFKREKNSDTQNITDSINGIKKIDIESYGQGETAETIQHSDKNPQVLIDFLDSFLDIENYKLEDKELIDNLRENQSTARKFRLELLSLDETKRALKNEQKKLENLKKEKAGELVKFQNALIKERQIRKEIIEKLNSLIKTYKDILSDNQAFEDFEKIPNNEIIVGKDFFTKVKQIVSDFSKIVSQKSTELDNELNVKIVDLKKELKEWSDKEKEIQTKIDEKKKELEEKGIPFDLGKINQISKDIIDLDKRVKKLENTQKELKNLIKQRNEFLKIRSEIKKKIFYTRYEFSVKINKDLKSTIEDLYITIKFDEGKYSDVFENQLKSIMGWRTSQVPKSNFISRQLTPLEFVEICKKRDKQKLLSLKDNNKGQLLSDYEVNTLISKINENYNYEDFESIEFEDRPSIIVTKIIKDDEGNPKHISKPISHLSLGQQQSVLLGILMLSKSKKPLIIDQPEDNLDSEFIFKTIVKNLRKIKESRQIIIVTHNPNIAVLGDAELIIPLKSSSVKSHIIKAGSIDRAETRMICCEILEGGVSAFKQRKEIYGI